MFRPKHHALYEYASSHQLETRPLCHSVCSDERDSIGDSTAQAQACGGGKGGSFASSEAVVASRRFAANANASGNCKGDDGGSAKDNGAGIVEFVGSSG